MKGYMGKILRIDLKNNAIWHEPLEEKKARMFIGGSGLGAKYLLDECDPNVDPLSPGNPLIIMTGPFCGTKVPTSGRHAVVTKSPLTGIFAESDVGGTWGYKFKKSGFDGIIIKEKASKPVYIWIDDGKVEIHDASNLWGKDTREVDAILRQQYGDDIEVMSIGVAGEKLVRFAAMITDGKDARAAGRCGVGAVMGSKNLKAIVVRGTMDVEVYDDALLSKSIKEISPKIVKSSAGMNKYGTASGVIGHESYGNFPVKNWTQGRWPEGAEKISGQKMAETILTGNYRCKNCIIGCGRKIKIESGPYAGVDGAGPEYETLGTLGSLCLIDNLEAIAYANELCNKFGMDTISAGGVIAFAMEAFEKGIITEKDTGGLELKFGNHEAMIEMIKQIANREGLGRLLGEGVRLAAEEMGGLAREFAMHVKGLEFPAHDPRAFNGLALSYATSNRGACHLAAFSHGFERALPMPELGYDKPHDRLTVEGKGEFIAKMQNVSGMYDSLKLCKFMWSNGMELHRLVEWVYAVTGWDYSFEEFMETGERIYNIKRLFNVKCGISRKDDTLPPRSLAQKRQGENVAVNLPHLGKMLSDYYEYRGWSEEGIPTEETLQKLSLI
ncbi:aldehyde ferredoxin oxidoreductase family protein [Petroclostridium xylanilyticum]|uniref:aldehyde ferredoxin oxidoreductase family protein n=1 Tax=Petroclostridium xylanilyticum TaxID=1792311 RepID=UPI000B99427B|nr:aldehyde ferredoxin oxidoreductase family protein [Petroclostridium xylanilyticum]